MSWLVLQLADSSFPAGGFAHSAGLEAAAQLGEVAGPGDVSAFLEATLWQSGLGALPFVGAAHDALEELAALDAKVDVFLTSHVTNRASRTQGRAFLATCTRVWDDARLVEMTAAVRERAVFAHHAPMFGAVLRVLGVARREALGVYLHLALRGVASAAVRLGLVGPHEAQRLQHVHAATLDRVLAECERLGVDEVAQPAPLVEMFGSTQDRLYSRLFQS